MADDGIMALDAEERIQACCAALISRRFVSEAVWAKRGGEKVKARSSMFLLCLDNLPEIERRLSAVGFALGVSPDRDYIEAIPAGQVSSAVRAGRRLSVFESKVLFGLAILYARKSPDHGRFGTVDARVGELVSLLVSEYRALDKEPTDRDLTAALQRFEACSLVSKRGGTWSRPETELMILPTMKKAVSPQSIASYERRYGELLDESEEAFEEVVIEGSESDES